MMLHTYDTTVTAVITYLKLHKIKVADYTVNETLQNHPDWPSLLSINDALQKWGVPSGVGKLDFQKEEQDYTFSLPTPFMVHTTKREAPYAIVTEVTDKMVTYRQGRYTLSQSLPLTDFYKLWGGVYMISEPDEDSGEKNYTITQQQQFWKNLMPVGLLLAGLLTGTWLFYNNLSLSGTADLYVQLPSLTLWLITILGLGVAGMLLWYEMDKNNPLLQKVCTGIAKGNCNAILTGKASKLFPWLSWSEVGFFYFAGAVLTLLFSGSQLRMAITWIALFNILALPYPVFSVYYQWRVAKQWCVLCLAVQGLLIAGAVTIFYNGWLAGLHTLSFGFIVKAALLYLLPVLLWYTVKPYLLRLQEAKNTKRQYLRTKFNTQVFETLLQKQKQITISTDGLGIDIGNPDAEHTIVKICSPYCGPCAKAHPEIEKLVEANNNIKAKIIFMVAANANDQRVEVVKHFLAIADKHDALLTKKALDDWYINGKGDYTLFANRYPMNGELQRQSDKLQKMTEWCHKMHIAYTPTIFINNYEIPDAYNIGDLQYFLQQE